MSIDLDSHVVEIATNSDSNLTVHSGDHVFFPTSSGIKGLDELAAVLRVPEFCDGADITLQGKSGKMYSLIGILSAHVALMQSKGTPAHGMADEMIDDGFGNWWSAYCPKCTRKSMVVVRPGKVQCPYCD